MKIRKLPDRKFNQRPRCALGGLLDRRWVGDVRKSSLMVRDFEGKIAFWDRSAERSYGYSRGQALGNVSHYLLQTIFPSPLSQINDELLSRKVWSGELIHTVKDGSRVKVVSRWELYRDENASFCVREINEGFVPIEPESSQLAEPTILREGKFLMQMMRQFRRHFLWVLLPGLAIFAAYFVAWYLTHDTPFAPLKFPELKSESLD